MVRRIMNVDTSKISKTLGKLKRKDPALLRAIQKKINQIGSCDEISIQHFKNLRHDSDEYKRVHIGSFVLIFRIDSDTVVFERFTHHDNAYK